MILTLIVLVCIWMGFIFNLLEYLIPLPIIRELPMWIISCIWFTIGLCLVVYRGYSTGYWKFLDFPIRGQIKSFYIDKINVQTTTLVPSKIDGLLRTPDGMKFYRDRKNRATLFSAGHEIRLIKDGINHTLSPDDLILTQQLHEKGVHNIREMDEKLLVEMMNLKETVEIPDKYGIRSEKKTIYMLTGTEEPPKNVDLDNPWHKHVYDELAKKWGWLLAEGDVVTVFQYNEFQRDLARSDDMASAIDYVRSTEALKAVKIRKKVRSGAWVWVLVAIVCALLVGVMVFLFTGGQIPGMPQ